MSYAVDKLAAHPTVLKQLRETGAGRLISVHLMPQNACSHRCSFCSYRLPDNKNSAAFNERTHIALPHLIGLLEDFNDMGVRGVEVTGGGEPLLYPYTQELWEWFAHHDIATALVTHGALMKDWAPLITQKMKWARVSIDAATRKSYVATRRCNPRDFGLAWDAVAKLRQHAPPDPEFRLGVGFVLSNENIGEVYDFVKRARSSGADNCRLTVTYSDQHEDFYLDKDAYHAAIQESIRAEEDFNCDHFKVNNLMPTRGWEIAHPHQDYRRCPTKDLLCVVEGEGYVYTCCTFAGSLKGRYGKFHEHPEGFRGLWGKYTEWRKTFDASAYCDCACLYRDRNLAMNAMIDSGDEIPDADHVHREFI